MRRSQTLRQRAGGYTLIELLAVIGIILLLIGLLLPAVQKFRAKGPEVATRNEISQLENAIEGFKTTHEVKGIPTCMWLTSDYGQSPGSVALNESRQFYSKVWPKGFISTAPRAGLTPLPPNPFPWPSGTPIPQPLNIALDGNQLLVLLLGGIPVSDPTVVGSSHGLFPQANFSGGRRTGFLNSPTNPFNYSSGQCTSNFTGERAKGPFFDFESKRIDVNGHYHDPHWSVSEGDLRKNVYYYFSSRNGNDYAAYGSIYYTADVNGNPIANPDPFRMSGITTAGGYGDPTAPSTLVNPFVGPDGKYHNHNGFQLISAGRDHYPGPGGLFPAPGGGLYVPGQPGGDDQANISSALLGGTR